MSLCPFAEHLLIPPGANDPRIIPRVAVLHVDAGDAESLYTYFRDRSGGVESHFHVRRDGVIEQYRDTDWQADANHLANDFAVSIETQGFGAGEWTPEQLASIKRLLVWLNQAHPLIALQKCPTWDGSGVGYHVQFGSPGAWTPVAKSCPGPDRVRQFHTVIVPWLEAGATEGDDVTPDDIEKVADRVVAKLLEATVGDERTVKTALRMASKAPSVARDLERLITANVVAAVPVGIDPAAIEDAVKAALREGTG